MLPFERPRVLFCVDDNFRCQTAPRRAGLALAKPAAIQPFLSGAPIEDVLITAADPCALVPDGTEVVRPRGCSQLDVGVSLGVLVEGGTRPAIHGYVTVLDFLRADVPRTQTFLARSFPTHKVVSSVVAPGVARDATVSMSVNSEQRQHGTLSSMIVGVEDLVAAIAHRYAEPGPWLITTGSPQGRPADDRAGWPQAGAAVAGMVDGVGVVRAVVQDEDPCAS